MGRRSPYSYGRIDGIKHLPTSTLADAPAERMQSGLYLVETANFVRQRLHPPRRVLSVFATATKPAASRKNARRKIFLAIASAGLIQKLVGTSYEVAVTAICVVRQRQVALRSLGGKQTVILAGEEIQDPRNVGVWCAPPRPWAVQRSPSPRTLPRRISPGGAILHRIDHSGCRCACSRSPDSPPVAAPARVPCGRQLGAGTWTVYDGALACGAAVVVVGNKTNGMTEPPVPKQRVRRCRWLRRPVIAQRHCRRGVLLYEAPAGVARCASPGGNQWTSGTFQFSRQRLSLGRRLLVVPRVLRSHKLLQMGRTTFSHSVSTWARCAACARLLALIGIQQLARLLPKVAHLILDHTLARPAVGKRAVAPIAKCVPGVASAGIREIHALWIERPRSEVPPSGVILPPLLLLLSKPGTLAPRRGARRGACPRRAAPARPTSSDLPVGPVMPGEEDAGVKPVGIGGADLVEHVLEVLPGRQRGEPGRSHSPTFFSDQIA